VAEMTLEEAVRVLREQRDFALDDTQRHPSLAQWFAERTQAIAIVAAHAERTVEARSVDALDTLRTVVESDPYHQQFRPLVQHIDTLTADLARVTAANEFARTEWAIWEEKACQLQARLDAVEADRDRLAACVERVRGVLAREEPYICSTSMADILAALEGTDG